MKNLYTVSYLALILMATNNVNAANAAGDFTTPYTGAATAAATATAHTHVPPYATATAAAAGVGAGDFTPPYTGAGTAAATAGAGAAADADDDIVGTRPDFSPVYRSDTDAHLYTRTASADHSIATATTVAGHSVTDVYARLQSRLAAEITGGTTISAAAAAGSATPFSYAAILSAAASAVPTAAAGSGATPLPYEAILTNIGIVATSATSAHTIAGGGAASSAGYEALLSTLSAPRTSTTAVSAPAPASEPVRVERPSTIVNLAHKADLLSMLMLNDALARSAYEAADERAKAMATDSILCTLTLRNSEHALNVLEQLCLVAFEKGFTVQYSGEEARGDLAGYFTNMMISNYYNNNHIAFLKEAIRVIRTEPVLDDQTSRVLGRLESAIKNWEDNPTG